MLYEVITVGRPMSVLMSQKAINATVTVAHSRTKDLKEVRNNFV